MPRRRIPIDRPLDLAATLAIHRRGTGDPSLRLRRGEAWRATRTPEGAATLHVMAGSSELRAEAWGPGADWALAHVPALAGVADDPAELKPRHPLLRELQRRLQGLRIGRTGAILESLIPAILEQKVTGEQARRGYRGLIARYGEPAPGPAGVELRLRLLPRPEVLARLPYYAYHPYGIEQRRADTVRRVAADATRLEAIVDLPIADAYQRLTAMPGVGPWTAAEVALRALGDVDAVSVGDFHLPNLVAWALAREPRADDTRMLELLEPYRGQRGRVVRLLEWSGIRPPAYGPRLSPQRIEAW
jgi:3-methyladenine DNA glycosylase/8-oxoguanine DNA glycosylase